MHGVPEPAKIQDGVGQPGREMAGVLPIVASAALHST